MDYILDGLHQYAIERKDVVAIILSPHGMRELLNDPRMQSAVFGDVQSTGEDGPEKVLYARIRGIPIATRDCIARNEVAFVPPAVTEFARRNGYHV